MDIAIEIPAGQKFEPGVHVKVRIDDGEPQDQVVQSAGRYLLSLPGQLNIWNEPAGLDASVRIDLDQ